MGIPFAEPIVIVDPSPLPRGGASFAPNTPAGTWPVAAMPVPFVLALPRSRDVGEAAAAELDVALRTWTRAKCASFRARFDGEKTAVADDDGANVVLFHDDAWPAELVPGAVAQTVVHTDPSGNYRDADIHLNGKEFRFSLDGRSGTLDLRSVLVHELGHALGLGHSSDARATMYASGSGVRWRSLEKDDIDGVCALYPGTGAAGCESVPCPSPFVCVASSCQRPKDARDVCSPCDRVENACEAAGDTARCIDIGAGPTAGRVCGRACSTDAECGTGFRCKPTTEAGDKQCVSDVACTNGANPCATDADCTDSVCRAGACVGAAPIADAGADASPADAGLDAGVDGSPPPDSSCDCATGMRSSNAPASAAMIALAAWLLRRRRR